MAPLTPRLVEARPAVRITQIKVFRRKARVGQQDRRENMPCSIQVFQGFVQDQPGAQRA